MNRFADKDLNPVLQDLVRDESKVYALLASNSYDFYWICDLDFNVLYISPNIQQKTGFTQEEIMTLSLSERYTSEAISLIHSVFEQEMQLEQNPETNQSRSRVLEVEHYKSDGSTILTSINVSFIRDEHGLPLGILVSSRDISNIKEIQLALGESKKSYSDLNQLFRLMADTKPDMLWAKDLKRQFIFVNRAICENLLCAESIEEPIGKTDMFFAERQRKLHPDNPHWHTFGEICRDSDSVTLDAMQTMRFDEFGNVRGKFLFLDVYKAPLIDEHGKLIGVVGSARDVTKEKAMEQDLQRESEFRQLLMEISKEHLKPSQTYVGDEVFRSLVKIAMFIKAERAHIFDYDSNSGLCTNTFEWCAEGAFSTVADYRDIPVYPEWKSAFAAGTMVNIPDTSGLEPSETKRALEASGVKSLLSLPLMLGSECFGFIGFDTVKNAHIYSEIDLLLLKVFSEMLASIRLRNKQERELILAKERAQESSRLKSSFLANMSHELRTPLNGILGFSEILTAEAKESRFQDMATMINTSGKRLLRTLDMILDITRIEANKQVIKKQYFDLYEQLHISMKLYLPLVQAKGLRISIDMDQSLYQVCTDPDILGRIIDELIYNAIKCTNAGKITLAVERVEADGNPQTAIHISDTGIGIPQNMLDVLFDAFRQVSEGWSRSHEGSGLGLTLCRKYAGLLGGSIGVSSVFGQGSTFTLTIPDLPEGCAMPAEAEAIDAHRVLPQSLSQCRVLLVDDDTIGCKMVSYMLNRDLHIDTVNHGREGLAKIQSQGYDLLLLDINLQDSYSGLDMIKDLRSNPQTRDLPVIAITAYAMFGDREHFLESGFTDYISKPLTQDILLQKVLHHLGAEKV